MAAGLLAGDRVHYTVLEDGTIILRVKNRSARDLIMKPRHARHVTVDRMNR